MTLEQFKNIDPGEEFILVYYESTESNKISAFNISTVDCDDRNITNILKEITELTVNINGTLTTFTVVNKNALTGYYHLLVESQEIPNLDSVEEGTCQVFYTNPPFLGTGFNKSEYQAILNNASTNRSTNFIFDVDRNNSQLEPTNYQSIMSGSATLAQYQELNYSSQGISNSRYSGAKTSTTDYGVSSALGVKTFDGASYLNSIEDSYICSQSLNERDIESFAYTGNTDFPVSGSRIFIFDGSKALPVRSRKIWVQDNNRILQVDGTGYIDSSGSLCSI